MNYRVHKTLALLILGAGALNLVLGVGPNMNDFAFGSFKWSTLLGFGLVYALWSFNELVST